MCTTVNKNPTLGFSLAGCFRLMTLKQILVRSQPGKLKEQSTRSEPSQISVPAVSGTGTKAPLTLGLALGHLVRPHADALLAVIGQTGRALVAVGLSRPAGPEGVAAGLVGEDAVQAGAVGCRDGSLCK